MKTSLEKFHNWTPIRIYWRQQPFVDWCYIGEERFTQPFFDNTIELLTQNPFNLLFRHQTPIEILGELHEQSPGLAPNGFIFHMSRCGSTLVAQMLSSLAQNIVISEPPAIDSILRSNIKNPAITDAQCIDWLKWLVSAFGQKRNDEEYYFIKFDSWSMIDLDLIRRAFPEVPWIFLYRNPIEVLVSQMRERGSQMIPGAIGQVLPGVDFMESLQMSAEEYCARVLARFCENAIDGAKSGNALMINYNQLPDVIASKVPEHFQMNYSSEDIERMKNAARFNAKTPQIPFTSDSAAKRKQASDAVLQASEKWVNPLYEQLEKIRKDR